MNCSSYQKAIRDREELSPDAAEHVAGCENCSRVEREETKLGALLRSTDTVGSPAGFETSVLSEIKSRRGRGAVARFWIRPAVLVPVFAAFLVLAFLFGFYRQYRAGRGWKDTGGSRPANIARGNGGKVEENKVATRQASPEPSSEIAESAGPSRSNGGDEAENLKKRRSESPESSTGPDPGGGSLDQAAKQAQPGRPVFPGAPRPADPDGATGPGSPLTPTKVFSLLGIEAEFGSSGWRVSSVRPRSTAANAGIRPGDIIRSLDGRVLTRAPLEGKSIEVRKLIVIRDGRQLSFDLKPGT